MKACVWCEFFPAETGDIYCHGCRSAVERERESGLARTYEQENPPFGGDEMGDEIE